MAVAVAALKSTRRKAIETNGINFHHQHRRTHALKCVYEKICMHSNADTYVRKRTAHTQTLDGDGKWMHASCIRTTVQWNSLGFHAIFHVYLVCAACSIDIEIYCIHKRYVCTRHVRVANKFSNSRSFACCYFSSMFRFVLYFSTNFLGMLHVSFDMLI